MSTETLTDYFVSIADTYVDRPKIKTQDLLNLGYIFDSRALVLHLCTTQGKDVKFFVHFVRREITEKPAIFSFMIPVDEKEGIVLDKPFSWLAEQVR